MSVFLSEMKFMNFSIICVVFMLQKRFYMANAVRSFAFALLKMYFLQYKNSRIYFAISKRM